MGVSEAEVLMAIGVAIKAMRPTWIVEARYSPPKPVDFLGVEDLACIVAGPVGRVGVVISASGEIVVTKDGRSRQHVTFDVSDPEFCERVCEVAATACVSDNLKYWSSYGRTCIL